MICLSLKNTDPFFCLAAEEYLLKNFDDDIFMLWQSENTIVVGKHQNAMAEINYRFVRENNITVARRISGGGTVFHDAGNVNFTFIRNVKSPAEISFKLFTEPVVLALARLGIEATTSGRNDLLIGGLKISGNAEHIYKNRVLHHGTLLFDADLANLGQAIKVVPGKYESKAVQSNRSKVANIATFLKQEMSIDEFIRFLLDVQLANPLHSFYVFDNEDTAEIETLVNEKFSTWEWNYGYSPKYLFQNEAIIDGKTLAVNLEVKKGLIEQAGIEGDHFSDSEAAKRTSKLVGQRHFYEDIQATLHTSDENLIYAFF